MICKLILPGRIFSVVVLLLASTLVVMAQNPVPFISQPLVPSAFAPSVPGRTFALTVNGTGFVSGSVVNWNGSPRTTVYANNSKLYAYILSTDTEQATTAWITVVNPAPGGGTSNVVFLPINNPTSTVSFEPRVNYTVGECPQYIATADFARNGKLDLVSANDCAGTASVLLGNGDGTFQNHVDYPAGGGDAQAPIVGDYNRDGILDLAVPYYEVAILLGRGDGSFGSPVFYSDNGSFHGITADFKGNGKLDLAIADSGVSILLGNGDGTFGPAVEYQAGGFSTTVATGDFNRDGILDLVTSNYDENTVSVLLGNGDGTFRTHVDYATGPNPGGVVVADVNGDGKFDLIVANQQAATVSVLLGNGDGTFRPKVDYRVSYGAVRVDVGDFNQDGKLDLAVATYGPTVDILLGNGDGTFQAPLSFPTGNSPWNALPADFNGDGHLDVATGNFDDGTISVLLQTPSSR
ncbi:MAG: VCBS repeat-containing protein [Candidatus Korobacteraceae bacterium]|jgi:VCBS repeat protein